jgi:plasmid stabilization system protein ParE
VKKYHVRITEKAEQDVASVLAWFRNQATETAGGKWFAQLMAAIDTLERMPERCGMAAEATDIGLDIREILVGKRRGTYRVLYQIEGRTVHILRVWHAARDQASREDL